MRDRKHDLVLARIARPLVNEQDFDIEILFQDPLLIAADTQSQWARRRSIDPAELVDAGWILTAPDTLVYRSTAEAFHARGLPMPKISIVALSGQLRMALVGRGPFVTAVPSSLLRFNAARFSLKILSVDIQIHGYQVAILTLKNRVLIPDRAFHRPSPLGRQIGNVIPINEEMTGLRGQSRAAYHPQAD